MRADDRPRKPIAKQKACGVVERIACRNVQSVRSKWFIWVLDRISPADSLALIVAKSAFLLMIWLRSYEHLKSSHTQTVALPRNVHREEPLLSEFSSCNARDSLESKESVFFGVWKPFPGEQFWRALVCEPCCMRLKETQSLHCKIYTVESTESLS